MSLQKEKYMTQRQSVAKSTWSLGASSFYGGKSSVLSKENEILLIVRQKPFIQSWSGDLKYALGYEINIEKKKLSNFKRKVIESELARICSYGRQIYDHRIFDLENARLVAPKEFFVHVGKNQVKIFMTIHESKEDAQTLQDIIEEREKSKRYFTREEIINIANEILLGLAMLHDPSRYGTLHKNLNPSTCQMKDRNVKLACYGIGFQHCLDKMSQHTCYIAPEVLIECKFTDKSDVFSFGMIMLRLITLKVIFLLDKLFYIQRKWMFAQTLIKLLSTINYFGIVNIARTQTQMIYSY
jgi:serine/threonine protein kinase